MPILAIKDNPPARYPLVPIGETGLPWYIAKVKSRQEKALAFDLLGKEVGYYLPLYSKVVKRPDNGKKRTTILPLFPSYLPFECEKVPDWLLRSERVNTIMEIRAQKQFLEQLGMLYRARECGLGLTEVDRNAFEVGQLVKIVEGPCAGLVGRLSKRCNGGVLAVQVEGLGYAGIHVSDQNLVSL